MNGQQGATIVSVTEETKIQKKPVGLNTVTLLKACSKGNIFEFANFLELKLVDFFLMGYENSVIILNVSKCHVFRREKN